MSVPTAKPKPRKHVYISPKAPGLRFSITLNDGKRIALQCENGRIELPTEQAEILDIALARNQGLSRFLQKVNYAAAEEVVRRHIEAKRPGAVKGAFSSDPIFAAKREVARASKIMSENAEPAQMAQLEKDLKEEGYMPKELGNPDESVVKQRAEAIKQLREFKDREEAETAEAAIAKKPPLILK